MSYIAIARAVYGMFLLLAPSAVIQAVSGDEPADRVPKMVGRVLGLRHLAQALVIDRSGTRGRLLAGAAIDATHALSMVGLAVLNRDHRWSAALDAVLATGLAANGLREVSNV